MKITAKDLKDLDIIDEIITEPEGGVGENVEAVSLKIKKCILDNIKELGKIDKESLVNNRYEKFRKIK